MDYLSGLPMDYPTWITLKFVANINLKGRIHGFSHVRAITQVYCLQANHKQDKNWSGNAKGYPKTRKPESGNRKPETGIRNPQIKENKFFKYVKIILHSFCL